MEFGMNTFGDMMTHSQLNAAGPNTKVNPLSRMGAGLPTVLYYLFSKFFQP